MSLEEIQALCEGRHIWRDAKYPQLSVLTCPVTEGTTKSSTSIISTIEFKETYEEGQCLPFVHTRYGVTVLYDGRPSLWPTYPQNAHSKGNLWPAAVVLWSIGMASSSCISTCSLPGHSELTLAPVSSGSGGWVGRWWQQLRNHK